MTPNAEWVVQPHGPLISAGEGILTVEGEIVMPLGRFPRRMTAVRLAGGGTAIWSAIALDAAAMARLEALGTPTFLIVPSGAHRLDAPAWKARFPALTVVTPPGAREGGGGGSGRCHRRRPRRSVRHLLPGARHRGPRGRSADGARRRDDAGAE